jgi:hypothetical protein
VQPTELELTVGDVVRVGNHLVTVVEIHGDEVTFKLVDMAHMDDDSTLVVRPR